MRRFIYNYLARKSPIGLVLFWAQFPLLTHVFLTYGYSFVGTVGVSMEPTMASVGDWVVLSKHYRRGRDIRVGDIVTFKHPLMVGEAAIKRVIGMPGDFVLRDTPGKGHGTMVQVPEGHCWLAGDNQAHSRDSRIFGPLPLGLIRGKVIARYWPLETAGWFENGLREPLDLSELD